uniref:Integrase catalytic domain-containing protein n=1 Tax=Cannabis sativa TaxID=3483 RepID=A0A803Q223_CANSA
MEEDESISEVHAKLCDISNESYVLGKVYSNKKLVRKVLGVLPKRFMSKVTSIEESRDIKALNLDELIVTEGSDGDDASSNSESIIDEKNKAYEENGATWPRGEIYKLTAEFVRTKQSLSHLPSGTAALNQILQSHKPNGDRTSIGYKLLYKQGHDLTIDEKSTSSSSDKIKFVSAATNFKNEELDMHLVEPNMNSDRRASVNERSNIKQKERFAPTCHFCNKRGHIRPRCYKLRKDLKKIVTIKAAHGVPEFRLGKTEKDVTISKVHRVRSDHGKEFENDLLAHFCDEIGICHEFYAPNTPQQNGIVEQKNRTLQEMARVMLCAKVVSTHFWAEAVNTACCICNCVHLRPGTTQTLYELWKGKTPNLSHFHIFGYGCYILNDRDHLGKFDVQSDEGSFLKYSVNSRAYRTLSLDPHISMMALVPNVQDTTETPRPLSFGNVLVPFENTASTSTNVLATEVTSDAQVTSKDLDNTSHAWLYKNGPPTWIQKAYPPTIVIGDSNATMVTQRKVSNVIAFSYYVSLVEPQNITEALLDEFWNNVMQDEMEQFKRNKVNKAKLVAQGYNQVEGVNFEETFAPVARLKSIRLMLAMTCFLKFKLHQMDVKSVFLNSFLQEEVYVKYSKGFEDPKCLDHVYKLKKAFRPDICFSVRLCVQSQANPKQSHLFAVKRIFKYLFGSFEFGLWYLRDTNMSIVSFSDSDWAGSLDDRAQLVDLFTNVLDAHTFADLRNSIGLKRLPSMDAMGRATLVPLCAFPWVKLSISVKFLVYVFFQYFQVEDFPSHMSNTQLLCGIIHLLCVFFCLLSGFQSFLLWEKKACQKVKTSSLSGDTSSSLMKVVSPSSSSARSESSLCTPNTDTATTKGVKHTLPYPSLINRAVKRGSLIIYEQDKILHVPTLGKSFSHVHDPSETAGNDSFVLKSTLQPSSVGDDRDPSSGAIVQEKTVSTDIQGENIVTDVQGEQDVAHGQTESTAADIQGEKVSVRDQNDSTTAGAYGGAIQCCSVFYSRW